MNYLAPMQTAHFEGVAYQVVDELQFPDRETEWRWFLLRATSGRIGEGQRAAVAADDLVDDGQPEPRAGCGACPRAAVEAVGHPRSLFHRDAGTVVAHRHRAVRDRHLDRRAGRAELVSVAEQVGDGPLDLRRLADHR